MRTLSDSTKKGHGAHSRDRKSGSRPGKGMVRYRIEVGSEHRIKPSNIVGAIANEAGLDGEHIGHIEINEDHSFVDLPEGMPDDVFRDLKRIRVGNRPMRISRASDVVAQKKDGFKSGRKRKAANKSKPKRKKIGLKRS